MSLQPKEPGNRRTREQACREIAQEVGMSCVTQENGWDGEILRLADICYFDKYDILQRPARVARAITGYLDDVVKNP